MKNNRPHEASTLKRAKTINDPASCPTKFINTNADPRNHPMCHETFM